MSYCRKQDPFYKITVWARHIYCQNSHLNTRKYCKKNTHHSIPWKCWSSQYPADLHHP